MELNKYYTPEIEEFFHGFEYEVWYSSAYTEEKWIKETFEFFDEKEIYHYDCVDLIPSFKNHGDSIRVKYLDKEDIESLGWKRDNMGAHQLTNQIYNKNNYLLMHDSVNNKISIIIRDPSKDSDMLIKGIMRSVNFLSIKNKSELKKLMKQLNTDDIQ